MAKEVWTVQRMLDWSKKYLEDKGLDSPALDAQILLGHVLKMSRMQLILDASRPMTDDELARYKAVLIRRVREHQPVAYILGRKEFWSLDLNVTPDVLIPRPDTECLVEHALAFASAKLAGKDVSGQKKEIVYETIDARKAYYQAVEAVEKARQLAETSKMQEDGNILRTDEICEEYTNHNNNDAEYSENKNGSEFQNITDPCRNGRKFRVVDIGTGSGAIALALRSELSESCEVCAVDISSAALDVARQNAAELKLNVLFDVSDLLERCDGQFDLIVSNPPYITTDEMQDLSSEVKNEPRLALEAGADGLNIYRRLVPEAFDRLNPGGALFVEIGCSQGDAVASLFREAGFGDVQIYRDYGRNPRVVSGIRAES